MNNFKATVMYNFSQSSKKILVLNLTHKAPGLSFHKVNYQILENKIVLYLSMYMHME